MACKLAFFRSYTVFSGISSWTGGLFCKAVILSHKRGKSLEPILRNGGFRLRSPRLYSAANEICKESKAWRGLKIPESRGYANGQLLQSSNPLPSTDIAPWPPALAPSSAIHHWPRHRATSAGIPAFLRLDSLHSDLIDSTFCPHRREGECIYVILGIFQEFY